MPSGFKNNMYTLKPLIQPKVKINLPGDHYEKEADAMADKVMRIPANENSVKPTTALIGNSVQRKCTACEEEGKKPVMLKAENSTAGTYAPPSLVSALHTSKGGGSPLPQGTRSFMENAFSADFSKVKVHTGSLASEMSNEINAKAFTYGNNIYFNNAQYAPGSNEGKKLLAHELAHTMQQKGNHIQRKIEMRDVGKGEQSGFAKLPDLVTKLNAISKGLVFSVAGAELKYTAIAAGTLSNFDTQMQGFIDQAAVIPLRLTNRHGLLGDRIGGYNWKVDGDAWASGYVDIDDLLAADELGIQMLLLHFIKERAVTNKYAERMTTPSLDTRSREFQRAHAAGAEAEAEILRSFFNDPSIKLVNDSPSPTMRRVYRNSRRDLIRRRIKIGKGVDSGVNASFVDVYTHDKKTYTPEEYRKIINP